MKYYGKITNGGQLQYMANPFKINVSNPDETMKAQLAAMFNWLEVVYTEQPEYNPETQYLTNYFEKQNDKALQVWEIHDIVSNENA